MEVSTFDQLIVPSFEVGTFLDKSWYRLPDPRQSPPQRKRGSNRGVIADAFFAELTWLSKNTGTGAHRGKNPA